MYEVVFEGPRAKWYCLNDGRWGVLGFSEQVRPGSKVEVQHRNGKVSSVVVDRVIWEGGRLALGTVARQE